MQWQQKRVNHPSLTEGACPVRATQGLIRGHENMQKLDRRDTYTPTDAPQVRSNCGHALNRDESLSVHGLKTLSNNPDVDILQPTGGFKTTVSAFVFVLNTDGESLMHRQSISSLSEGVFLPDFDKLWRSCSSGRVSNSSLQLYTLLMPLLQAHRCR